MGISFYTKVIFGIPEPKDWKNEKRTTQEEIKERVCPNGHFTEKKANLSWQVCPLCGAELSWVSRTVDIALCAEEVYCPPGLDPNDPHFEEEMLNWIHTVHISIGEPIYLGLQIGEIYWRDDVDAICVPEPDADTVSSVRQYLNHLGYRDEPKLYVLLCS